ncbi:hypothetical protein AAKU55_000096 [Oxalobacteraceae bacterium GrIS 1.11]
MGAMETSVRRVGLPEEAGIAAWYQGSNLADAYAVCLPAEAVLDPEALARFMFGGQPRWVGVLMRLRDAMVAAFGLKTARQMQGAEPARRIGIFKIYSSEAREIVLGENDRHLDFRVSVLCRADGDATLLLVSTVVHCHNRLGRLYIKLIAPFHRLVVRSTLGRAARSGWRAR